MTPRQQVRKNMHGIIAYAAFIIGCIAIAPFVFYGLATFIVLLFKYFHFVFELLG